MGDEKRRSGWTIIGQGFSSQVVETESGNIIKIPKNQEAADRLALEARLLPSLVSRLPVPVPRPEERFPPGPDFPFGAISYVKLSGRPLKPIHLEKAGNQRLIQETAAFLTALHQLPLSLARQIGLPEPHPSIAEAHERWREVKEPLKMTLQAHDFETVAAWWQSFAAAYPLERFDPVIIHGDFWYENMLVDDLASSLTGVLDFENAAIGDPAQDLVTLGHLGQTFADQVLDQYGRLTGRIDKAFRRRLAWLWPWREFDGLAFAIRHDDRAEFEDAMRKLRAGPILSA